MNQKPPLPQRVRHTRDLYRRRRNPPEVQLARVDRISFKLKAMQKQLRLFALAPQRKRHRPTVSPDQPFYRGLCPPRPCRSRWRCRPLPSICPVVRLCLHLPASNSRAEYRRNQHTLPTQPCHPRRLLTCRPKKNGLHGFMQAILTRFTSSGCLPVGSTAAHSSNAASPGHTHSGIPCDSHGGTAPEHSGDGTHPGYSHSAADGSQRLSAHLRYRRGNPAARTAGIQPAEHPIHQALAHTLREVVHPVAVHTALTGLAHTRRRTS